MCGSVNVEFCRSKVDVCCCGFVGIKPRIGKKTMWAMGKVTIGGCFGAKSRCCRFGALGAERSRCWLDVCVSGRVVEAVCVWVWVVCRQRNGWLLRKLLT